MLADGGKFASEIAKSLEISTQKASGLLVQLEKSGQVGATEVKVPKKGKAKFYKKFLLTNPLGYGIIIIENEGGIAMATISRKALRETLRTSYLDLVSKFLADNGEEILRTKSNEIALPCVDAEGNDDFVVISFKVPTGERGENGSAYDGYSEAEDYAMKCAEKTAKAKEAAEKKAKKIAKDKAEREARAKAKAEHQAKAEG